MARVPLRSRIPMNSIEFQRIPMEFYISYRAHPPRGPRRKKRPARWEAASGKGGPRPRDSRQKMIPRKGDPGFPLLSWDPKPYLKAPARPAPGGAPDHILAQ